MSVHNLLCPLPNHTYVVSGGLENSGFCVCTYFMLSIYKYKKSLSNWIFLLTLKPSKSEAGIFIGEFWSLPDGRYILGARAIERRDFHRYNSRAAVKWSDRNSERHTTCHKIKCQKISQKMVSYCLQHYI